MILAGELQGDRALEKPIELGAEGASRKRNSQAKGQRGIIVNLLIFADRLLFVSGLFSLKGDLDIERILRASYQDKRRS